MSELSNKQQLNPYFGPIDGIVQYLEDHLVVVDARLSQDAVVVSRSESNTALVPLANHHLTVPVPQMPYPASMIMSPSTAATTASSIMEDGEPNSAADPTRAPRQLQQSFEPCNCKESENMLQNLTMSVNTEETWINGNKNMGLKQSQVFKPVRVCRF